MKNNDNIILNVEPLISNIKFTGEGISNKQIPKVSFSLNPHNHTISAPKSADYAVMSYQDPFTGFYITDDVLSRRALREHKSVWASVHNCFTECVQRELRAAVKIEINRLTALKKQNLEKYSNTYKDLDAISTSLFDYVDNYFEVIKVVNTQVRMFKLAETPNYNLRLAFKNTNISSGQLYTSRVPYLDPAGQDMDHMDQKIVGDFMSVFADSDNAAKIAWYYGAMLANKPISDNTVSKMMVVTSNKAGTGKSTLFMALSNALATTDYYQELKSFDSVYSKRDRFSQSILRPGRLFLFDEANFSDSDDPDKHDFSELYVNSIKHQITLGELEVQQKFQNTHYLSLPNLMIVLSNYIPQTNHTNDLARRILPVVLKPSTMMKKGRKLGLESTQEVYQYVAKHAQSFANVFYRFYADNPNLYRDSVYNPSDLSTEVKDSTSKKRQQDKKSKDEFKALAKKDLKVALKEMAEIEKLDLHRLYPLLDENNENKLIYHSKKGHTYLLATKKYLTALTGEARTKQVFAKYFGPHFKKFGNQYFLLQ